MNSLDANSSADVGGDTIVAPATTPGAAAVAVVRLSGAGALAVAGRVFVPRGPGFLPDRRLVLGTLRDAAGDDLDEALAVAMRGPRSFTGEDVVEFQMHGGPAIVDAALAACVVAGARPAQPGEFTRRAFLNRRLDLAQAEAVADLVAARSEKARRLALRQLRGGLSERIGQLRASLVDAAAEIEAHLDFPDEDIPDENRAEIGRTIRDALRSMEVLLATHKQGRIAREGARVVLAGPPNAGKSSLFNALVGRERAIVTPHPGTTRDSIECTLEIGGLAVTLVDTAGMRESPDEVERIGIERTRAEIRDADLVLYLDDSPPAPGLETPALHLVPKADLLPESRREAIRAGGEGGGRAEPLPVSSETREGLDRLEAAIVAALGGPGDADEAMLASARHAECLRAARSALERAAEAFAASASGDLVMVDIRESLDQLGEITGGHTGEDILDRIFGKFCLGK